MPTPTDPARHRPAAAAPVEVSALLSEATGLLVRAGVDSPRVDAELLLAHVLSVGRGDLLVAAAVPPGAVRRYRDLIRLRAERTPLQHLTGRIGFRQVELEVGPGVFVPRPETESMAGWVIDALRADGAGPAVLLELGLGSGAISAAVLDEVPAVTVFGVELDEPAFDYAERNLASWIAAGRARLALADMAEALTVWPELAGRCDVVVSNPPYIPLDAYESVAPEARDHDPALALWSGADGLAATRVVAAVAGAALRPGGWVASEHAEVQAESAPAVFSSTGQFDLIRDQPDLTGRPRFVTARRSRR